METKLTKRVLKKLDTLTKKFPIINGNIDVSNFDYNDRILFLIDSYKEMTKHANNLHFMIYKRVK